MGTGPDRKIGKLEKGPLQRFKNQNLLLKKFGEVGLQVYKAITGKRTTEELRSDLDMEEELFSSIIDYMEEAGMVELTIAGKEAPSRKKEKAEEAPAEIEAIKEFEETPEPVEKEEPEEEILPEEAPSEDLFEEEILLPEEEPAEEEKEEIAPELEPEPEESVSEGEIIPELEEEEPPKRKKAQKEDIFPEEEPLPDDIGPEIEKEPEEEIEEFGIEEEKEKVSDEIEFRGFEDYGEEETESPVEKTIKDKYGDIGIQVYTLIDGARTAEEIMEETGLDEAKLVEILDFLDEEGIIKLEYPKGKSESDKAEAVPKEIPAEQFGLMTDEDTDESQMIRKVSPDIIPKKLQIQIVKSVQLRAKTMLRFGDTGDKVLAAIDSKSDLIELAIKLNIPLFRLMEILAFLKSEGGIELNPMPRAEIRRRYGDDGFAVYKKHGKEGLMLYELIGKEMGIKEMAAMITPNNALVFEIFLFIYEVLGIEMPINKDALKKQLGI